MYTASHRIHHKQKDKTFFQTMGVGSSTVPAVAVARSGATGRKLVVDPAVVMRREINDDLKKRARLVVDADPVPRTFAKQGTAAVYAPPRCPQAVLEHRGTCGLAAAFMLAYNNHLPLRLSPDVLWITILQSVSEWVNKTPERTEKYRTVFVKHEGKMVLEVGVPPAWEADRSLVQWDTVLQQIRDMAAGHVNNGIVEATTPTFSTTNAASVVACTIATLDIVKAYFLYGMMTYCGIGEVVLEGTPEDWTALRARATAFQTALGEVGTVLAPWFAQLDGTLAELAATAAGRAPDAAFWAHAFSKEIKHGSGGGTYLSGWFLHFFFASEKLWAESVHLDDLPCGYVSVPFHWAKLDGSLEMFSLCSGVWNAYVDADGAVFCEPQWVVLPGETPPSKRIEEIGTAVAAGRVESTLVAPDTWVERVRGMPKEQRDSVDSSVPSGPLSWWK
jgi:hypothetical protein